MENALKATNKFDHILAFNNRVRAAKIRKN